MLLFAYVVLQLLDALTTLAFLGHGIQEANPLVRLALGTPAHPVVALALLKAVAVLLGVYAWRSGHQALLCRMNLLFAFCVTWNVAAVLLA